MDKIDMGDFIQYLRPNPLDKAMGISPEQRAAMDAERAERDAHVEQVAIEAMSGLTEYQCDCLFAYFKRCM